MPTRFTKLRLVLDRKVASSSERHFLFYLRDATFECDAEQWEFRAVPAASGQHE